MASADIFDCWGEGAVELRHSHDPENDVVRPFHDRMPVIVAPEHDEAWLDSDTSEAELKAILHPKPKILRLELKTASLPGIWPAVVQPIPAYYVRGPYKKGTHTSVTVKYPDGSVVTISAITDAEAGPKAK